MTGCVMNDYKVCWWRSGQLPANRELLWLFFFFLSFFILWMLPRANRLCCMPITHFLYTELHTISYICIYRYRNSCWAWCPWIRSVHSDWAAQVITSLASWHHCCSSFNLINTETSLPEISFNAKQRYTCVFLLFFVMFQIYW